MSNKNLIGAALYAYKQWHKSGDVSGAMQQLYIEAEKAKNMTEASPESSGDWYEKGGLPPVGTECEVLNPELHNSKWENCKILYIGKFICVYDSDSCNERVGKHDLYNIQFRPIKTDRERAIKAARDLISANLEKNTFDVLYDAGLLRLPEDKNGR